MATLISAHLEPFGLSSIESQSCGTPVIGIREGGVQETIVNGKTGYVTDRRGEHFLDKIKMTITNQDVMKIASRENTMKYWDWEVTLKPLDKIFYENLRR